MKKLAAGFRELGLGTIVGWRALRWIIFTIGCGLVDGSFYRPALPGVCKIAFTGVKTWTVYRCSPEM